MNENNQQQHPVTPTHSWGVITEVEGGFNGEPVQHAKAKATQYIKATLAAFGPGEAISMTLDTWANLHGAMSVLVEQPAQHQPQAIHQWRLVNKPELGWFDDTHERAYHADPKMEGRTLYSAEQPAQQEPVALAQQVIGCFHAAEIEGLTEALANTTHEHLKDLVERRLMHALYAAQEVERNSK